MFKLRNNFKLGYCLKLDFIKEYEHRKTLRIRKHNNIDFLCFTLNLMLLESDGFITLHRFIDALTPTLTSLHPLSVLNHLHLSCMWRVEAANVLKRDQYLSQLTGGGSKRSTAERTKSDSQPHSIYEECIATQIQGTVILPKVSLLGIFLCQQHTSMLLSLRSKGDFKTLLKDTLYYYCYAFLTNSSLYNSYSHLIKKKPSNS